MNERSEGEGRRNGVGAQIDYRERQGNQSGPFAGGVNRALADEDEQSSGDCRTAEHDQVWLWIRLEKADDREEHAATDVGGQELRDELGRWREFAPKRENDSRNAKENRNPDASYPADWAQPQECGCPLN